MRTLNWTSGTPLLYVFLLSLCGCQGEPQLATEYVEGVVTLDGTPVEGATIAFQPVKEGEGIAATGFTDANGVYKLTAVNGKDGAQPAVEGGTLPGEYYVSVTKTQAETPLSQEEAEAAGKKYVAPSTTQGPKLTYIIPKKYQQGHRSGLKVTVSEGKNDIPLELTSK